MSKQPADIRLRVKIMHALKASHMKDDEILQVLAYVLGMTKALLIANHFSAKTVCDMQEEQEKKGYYYVMAQFAQPKEGELKQ